MDKNSLSHADWERVYHIVLIPKHGRKVLYGEMRREVGEIPRALTERMDGVDVLEGTACPDHIRICPRIAPELRRVTGRDRTLWARGRYVSAVGLNESVIRRYIQRQEEGSRIE